MGVEDPERREHPRLGLAARGLRGRGVVRSARGGDERELTITELIHRADLLEKLEATGTVYQHAIQKVAVAQAASTTTPVQQIVKSLNELTTQAFHRVYRDARAGLFPDPRADQFAALAAKLSGDAQGPYIFNGALANHLKDARGWDEKVLRLLTVMNSAPVRSASLPIARSISDTSNSVVGQTSGQCV